MLRALKNQATFEAQKSPVAKIVLIMLFFHCFPVKFTKIHGILSNFEPKNREKFKQILGLRLVSGCFYKKMDANLSLIVPTKLVLI